MQQARYTFCSEGVGFSIFIQQDEHFEGEHFVDEHFVILVCGVSTNQTACFSEWILFMVIVDESIESGWVIFHGI